METFFVFLERRVRDCNSLLCVGLDPHQSNLSAPNAKAALDFCLRLIKETSPYTAAFKPNAAFFEAFGPDGWEVLKQVIETIISTSVSAGSRIPIILDAKRGDIASTAEAYAKSSFETIGADCITLSPYLGKDSIVPFIANPEKGVFLLCKTSNPGAGDLQDVTLENGITLYEHVAKMAVSWNTNGNIGLVVGATQPEALRRVRIHAPDLWILAPGVGAQGGDLEKVLLAGLRPDGMGMLIPVSRGISRAKNWAKAASKLRDEINNIQYSLSAQGKSRTGGRDEFYPQRPTADFQLAVLAEGLLGAGCIKFGEFTLKSGLISPIYIDLRQLVTYPKLLAQVALAYLPILKRLKFDRLACLPYAAIPIATAISLQSDYPLIYPRKEIKTYGMKAEIEGEYHAGETVVVIDDLTTTGGSKFEAIEKLTAAGLKVQDVVVLIDRQSGAKEAMAEADLRLHAVLTISDLLTQWERTGRVPAEVIAETREFLKRNQ